MNRTARKRRPDPAEDGAAEEAEQQGDPLTHRNEVVLVGRVSKPLEKRALPSGDVVGTLRIIVERDARTKYRRSGGVDTIPCAAWSAKAQRAMASWDAGDVVEVGGSLRRRWFRQSDGSSMSDYEIEVSYGRRLALAA
jgi:single-strand DNA-binding protein